MKIEYYEGCTSSAISVDGVYIDEENFDKQKMIEVATAILNSLEQSTLEFTLRELISGNSRDIEDHGHCETCGDYPRTYKLEI